MEESKKESHTEHHEHKNSEEDKTHHESDNSHIHHTQHHTTHHSTKPIKYNVWMIATVLLAVVVIVLLVLMFMSGVTGTGSVISGEEAGTKLTEFLNLRTGGGVEYLSYEDKGNIYEVTVNYQDQSIPVYITKDGSYFVQGAVPLAEAIEPVEPECTTNADCLEGESCQGGFCVPVPEDVPKSDKPEVELFVMTHCPYGTQAEKGIIPTIKELGNKVDFNVRFVHYFMHGDEEEAETYNQVCIREEQSTKYIKYLECFLEDGDSARCNKVAGINEALLKQCIEKKSKEYYKVDSDLSNKYGVQGSPTLVINGVQANSARDSASYLSTICSTYTDGKVPDACDSVLSSASPSPGFGYSASGGTPTTNAQCL